MTCRPPNEFELRKPAKAYEYARDVAQCRVPELEPLIATDAFLSLWYMKKLVKGRWRLAEDHLYKRGAWAWPDYRDWLRRHDPVGHQELELEYGFWRPD